MAHTILNENRIIDELSPDLVISYNKPRNCFVVTANQHFYEVPRQALYSTNLRFTDEIVDELLRGSENCYFEVLIAPSAQTHIFLIREHNISSKK